MFVKSVLKKSRVFLVILLVVTGAADAQEKYTADWESLKKHKVVPEWFADAKLGVYFHWGVYSVPAWGSEWYPRWMYVPDREGWGSDIYTYHKETYGENVHYHDFIPQWKAENFDAEEWVNMFENMGARIIGSIAEHHDGFSLWDSEVNEWNSVDKGPGIDVVKAIADETRKRGLKFMATFHHGFHMMFYPKVKGRFYRPESVNNLTYDSVEVPQDEKYRLLYGNISYDEANDLWLAKLNEVIDAYCPDYIWMDFGQRNIKESYRMQFLANYFNKAETLNKEVVVNTKGTYFPTDIAVVNVERSSMREIAPRVWITDFILGANWSYNKSRRTALDPDRAIRMLADVVSKNGVMLLSAGPMADGTIPVEQVKSMEGIGSWMKLYGEAIYETRPFVTFGEKTSAKEEAGPGEETEGRNLRQSDLSELGSEDIRYTRKGKTVYAIQLGWPGGNKEIILNAFADEAKDLGIRSVSVLGCKEKIVWERNDEGLKISSPTKKPERAEAALVFRIETK